MPATSYAGTFIIDPTRDVDVIGNKVPVRVFALHFQCNDIVEVILINTATNQIYLREMGNAVTSYLTVEYGAEGIFFPGGCTVSGQNFDAGAVATIVCRKEL